MFSIGLVISIAVPILILLAFAVFVSKQQQKRLRQKAQARVIKDFIANLIEALEFLLKVDNQKDIQKLVLVRIKQLNLRYERSLPKNDQGRGGAVDFVELQQKVAEEGKNKQILKSDQEIRYAKKQFSKILQSFGPMVKNKTVSAATILQFRRYLRISILEMEVDLFSTQGDLAAQRGDVATASGYYKIARKTLLDFNMQYAEKNLRIKQLADKAASLFNGVEVEKRSLAKELMEEEPDKDVHGFPLDPNYDRKKNF
jgi:hypothetical protein